MHPTDIADIKRKVKHELKQYVFSLSHPDTWRNIRDNIGNVLVNDRRVYDWMVICDGTNNFSNTLRQGILYVDVVVNAGAGKQFFYLSFRLKGLP